MAGTTNFLQWNPGAANQETDAQYAADSMRTGGAPNGTIFSSSTANKLFYQLSTLAAALTQSLANKGYSPVDTSLSTLEGVLANIVTFADLKPNQITVPFSANPVFDCSLANGFRIDLAASVTSSTLINTPAPGTIITFYIVSGNPGNFSFAWPGNIQFPPNVQLQSVSNLLSYQFISDGTQLFPLSNFLTFLEGQVNALQAFQAAQIGENAALTSLANTAQASANAAQGTANTALTTATNASNAASAAQGSANAALAEIAALQILYTVHDVTGSRFLNVAVANPYGLPMTVTGFAITNGGGNVGSVECLVNGVSVFANTVGATVNNGTCGFSFEVPSGATYEVLANSRTNNQGTAVSSIGKWIETTKSV